uniref:Uncharacterized protein n=1 Tax=Anguilla anguilla TaxID=7936 RepID=A0A0E9U163_ANGAN
MLVDVENMFCNIAPCALIYLRFFDNNIIQSLFFKTCFGVQYSLLM